MTRRALIGLLIAAALIGGIAAARAMLAKDHGNAADQRPAVNVGPSGDPITAVSFDYLPEGTAPLPYSANDPPTGANSLALIATKLPTSLPEPDPNATGSCNGLAVRFKLRSGRELYYLPCKRPAAVNHFLTSIGDVWAG